MNKGAHRKLKSPWVGPYIISKKDKKDENVYLLKKKDDARDKEIRVHVRNIKKAYIRPKWMSGINFPKPKQVNMEVEEVTKEIPADDFVIEPITDNIEEVEQNIEVPKGREAKEIPTHTEEVSKEVNSNSKERPKRKSRIPQKGEEIDVKFLRNDSNKDKTWYCGKVEDRNDKQIFIKFLDGEEGWYTVGNQVGKCDIHQKEIRSCIVDGKHKRVSYPQAAIMIITSKQTENSFFGFELTGNSKKRKDSNTNNINVHRCATQNEDPTYVSTRRRISDHLFPNSWPESGLRPETSTLETDKERFDFSRSDLEVNTGQPTSHIAIKTIWRDSNPIELKGDARTILMTLKAMQSL
jgi:hypothetical protein